MQSNLEKHPFPPENFDTEIKSVPQVYFNGFVPSLTSADIGIALLLDNSPTLKLNMSYTAAKSLAEALADIVKTLEESTGTDIMTADTVNSGMSKLESDAK